MGLCKYIDLKKLRLLFYLIYYYTILFYGGINTYTCKANKNSSMSPEGLFEFLNEHISAVRNKFISTNIYL